MSLHPDFVNELRTRFMGDIRLDTASRILYSTDASMYQIEPLGVLIPKTQDDLLAAVELAVKYKVPILPRGAGSSLGGQAIGHALILDCSRQLDGILEIEPESRTAIVEPGVLLSSLNAACARHGLIFGPDPASAERATMGGVIGNNATGAHSILYGMSADHIVSADVILGDGTLETWDASFKSKLNPVIQTIRKKHAELIKQNHPKTWRNSAGYRLNYLLPWGPSAPSHWIGDAYPANLTPDHLNLAPLLAGSEGTLAIMRRATVKLVPSPKHTILGILSYQSIPNACDDVPRLLELSPSAIELIPQTIMRLARSVPAYAHQTGWIVGDPAAVLVVEFSGNQPSALKEAVRRIGDVLTIAESKEEQARVWNVRKMGLGILDSRPRAARPAAFIEDCAIPVERLGEFVREVERILSSHNTDGGIYAHASAGCLHIRPILDLQTTGGVRALRSIGEQVFALTMRLGGSMSSEHGDGIVAGEWIERTYGKELTDAMRMVKRTSDPENLLNPNKLFDAPPMDTHLRYGETYKSRNWRPSLVFDHERGLAGAIEQCNGQGVCRKDSGTMCPSFQATRDEMHSTRGRANLLRALINSQTLEQYGETNVANSVFAALDLCLGCKGCKAECPSGVDVAKLKHEFENEYYKSHRRPPRDYIFGYFHIVAKTAAFVPAIVNLMTGNPFFRELAAKTLGITTDRPFPKFSTHRPRPVNDAIGDKKIIFLSDPFSRYIEPGVEQAAYEVLSAFGYTVRTIPIVGAGAALLSNGFIEPAKRHAAKVLDALKMIDPGNDTAIVGIEPPEIYCLKNDYMGLLPERKEYLASINDRTWLLDEFLLRSDDPSQLRAGKRLNLTSPKITGNKIKFQPHCHQRAERPANDGFPTGTFATVELLRSYGYDVETLDTGCCGMAGTFGYEAEHYPLSMQVGELKLFPLLRKLIVDNQDPTVAATGAACRMQIFQGVGVEACHPIELVRDALQFEKNWNM